MKEITGINHVGLRVRDLDISRSFYEKLGFDFIVGPVGPEPVAIVLHPCGVNFNLILNASSEAPSTNVLMEEPIKYPGYTHIALEITDAASMAEKITELGLSITEEVNLKGQNSFLFEILTTTLLNFINRQTINTFDNSL